MLRVTINQVNRGEEGWGQCHDWTDEDSGRGPNFGRAGDGIAAKIEFGDAREREVGSRASGFHDPNEISGFQLSGGL